MNPHPSANGAPPAAVAQITITMLANGNVVAQCQAPNAAVAFGMIEQAKLDLHAEFKKKVEQAIQVAPPGVHF